MKEFLPQCCQEFAACCENYLQCFPCCPLCWLLLVIIVLLLLFYRRKQPKQPHQISTNDNAFDKLANLHSESLRTIRSMHETYSEDFFKMYKETVSKLTNYSDEE